MQLNSDELRAAVETARANSYRPTIKGVVYDLKGRFVSFASANYRLKMNFPGGGIDAEESPLYGFHREMSEETYGIEYARTGLLGALLLAEGRVATTRTKWEGKHLWLYAVQTTDVHSIRCRYEIDHMRIHSVKNTQSFFTRLADFTDTSPDVADLYERAILKLERILT